MNLLRTDKTYKTYANAFKALENALDNVALTPSDVRYLIAVNEEGRFAPVVSVSGVHDRSAAVWSLPHHGITIIN